MNSSHYQELTLTGDPNRNTRFAMNTAGRINLETTTLRLMLRTQPRSEERPFIGRSKAGCRAADTFCSRHPAPAPNPSSPRDPEA